MTDLFTSTWRSEGRKGYRNGSRNRTLKTTEGNMELMKPQIREFPFSTHVFERYSEVEKAPNSVILESCIQGTSTRNVMDVVESPGAENIYPHPVSTPASELDSKVKSILVRGIDRTMKFIYKDATHFNTRERWKVWKQSVVCVN